MSNNYDVIFAGAGVMGCATAYNLLLRDPNLKILLVERDSSYERNSTVLSDGNMRIQFNLEPNIRISQYGMQVMETFDEVMTSSTYTPATNFRRQGNMFLFSKEGEANARKGYETQKSFGCDVELLSSEQIADYFPWFEDTHGTIAGATFGPGDGTMSPRDILLGYRHKAVDLGATVIEAEVAELLKDGSQMTGIKLKNGDVYNANIVANVTGSWATILAETVGVTLPITPIKREVYSVKTDQKSDAIMPMMLFPSGQYLIHEGAGSFITGGKHPLDPVTFTDFSWHQQRFEDHMWEGLVNYIPCFDRLQVHSGWGALYAVNTLDANAILGEWPTLKGYFCANGFSGHGFQQSHAVGRYIAELMLGVEPTLDLSIFGPQRILDNAPVFENPDRLI